MHDVRLPDKIIKKIRIPVFGYNTLKFVIYLVIGVVLSFIVFAVFRSTFVFMIIMGVFIFLGFIMSVVKVNGEVDLDVYIFSLLGGREKTVRGVGAEKLVLVDSISKDESMLKIGGSYAVVLRVEGDTVGVMSDDKAAWYFEGFLRYEREASPDITTSIIFMPKRYDPTPIVNTLKPRAGAYEQDLAEEYKAYLESFRNVRAYSGLVILRTNPGAMAKGKNARGVDVEQVMQRMLGFELEKVVRSLGSRGIRVSWVRGPELFELGKTLYNGGFS